MSARDITLHGRTTTIEGFLSRYWWGERDRADFTNPIDDQYAACYPASRARGETIAPDRGIAQEMILRRREKEDARRAGGSCPFLGGIREERKAIITITDGWRLYGPNPALARPIDAQVPIGPWSASIRHRHADDATGRFVGPHARGLRARPLCVVAAR
jgi:hypothetical protein